jgi:RNA polymerase sigma factor (sigma-70 family)
LIADRDHPRLGSSTGREGRVADRDNDAWVAELKGQRGKQIQEKAFQDLGNALLSPVRWYLTNRSALPPGLSHGSFHDLDQLAQDIVQDSLVRIWQRGLKLYRGETRFLTYAKVIAINQARQKLRQMWQKGEKSLPLPCDENIEEGDEERFPISAPFGTLMAELSPEKQVMLKDVLQSIDHILDRWCSRRERQAFVRKYLDNLRSKEIAQLMNTTDRAVNMLTFNARNRLREGLEDEGYTLATLLHVLDC